MFDCLVYMKNKMYINVFKVAVLLAMSMFTIALCEKFTFYESMTAVGTHENTDVPGSSTRLVKKDQIQRTRFRRARRQVSDRCNTSSKCTGDRTFLGKKESYYNCYCDNACYETFQDCCPDFVETCGEQKKTNKKISQSMWKCLTLAVEKWYAYYYDRADCHWVGPSGIWVIANCSRNWALDETRARCENASDKFFYPVENFLPVVGKNGFTYRNKHCAKCNGETSYQTWDIVVRGLMTPPEQYDLDDKLRFVLANEGKIEDIAPAKDMFRRYCGGVRYRDSCSNKSHSAYKKCLNGPVESVGDWWRGYFKNYACALCNGEGTFFEDGRRSVRTCFSGSSIPEKLSIVFYKNKRTNSESTVTRVVKKDCRSGLVYDDILQSCRKGLITNIHDTLSDVFLIALWFEQNISFSESLQFEPNIDNITKHLKSSLVKNFALKPNQLTDFQFHLKYYYQSFELTTFQLRLTPYQKFILANEKNTSNFNISTESQTFLRLLKFTTKFTIQSGGYRFPVIKLVSKQLACFEGRTLQSHEYEHDNISGNVIQNTTGNVFSKNQYAILGQIGGNITICRRLVLSGCHNGAFVTLYKHEYFVFQNLTIFHHQTNRTFNFGEYQIIEGGNSNQTNSEAFQNASFPSNITVSICLPFRQTFNTSEKIVTNSDTLIRTPLRILTVICFSISILFLFILLVTYWMFNELRTLPGLNLMSLAVSMLLSHLLWLVSTAHFKNTKTCKVLTIIQHYLFLVTFMAMSVISYHSCNVFSRPFNVTPNNALPARKKFTKYSSMAWIFPAIFIMVCVTLDLTETTFDIYSTTCWLSTGKAVLYLFILPAAVIMLFNITTFIKTALALCYNNNSQILHNNRKQNLIACTKLATLVGFPWLFAFFGVIFPDIEAFEYLFVVFACLQGFYIGATFLFNKKTFLLYKNWWKSRNTVSA